MKEIIQVGCSNSSVACTSSQEDKIIETPTTVDVIPTLQTSPQRPSSKMSPLKQHAVSPLYPPSTPDATQTIFLNHPSARLSSSPASSPRIVDAPPARRGSVHPTMSKTTTMSKTMEKGMNPGVDFFDDESSGSDWEDSEGDLTQNFPQVEGLGLRSLVHGLDRYEEQNLRGRSRERTDMTALPSFHAVPIHDSGLGISSPIDSRVTRRARPMSLKRLSKDDVHVINHRSSTGTSRSAGTPRDSPRSRESGRASPAADMFKPVPRVRPGVVSSGMPHSTSFHGRRRRNTSESMIADSIINAHATTMRALEALNVSPSRSKSNPPGRSFLHSSSTSTQFPKVASFSNNRHITLLPLSTSDQGRPAHLPSHFIKTPYPFTAKKEFPKPISRPRQQELTRLDSGYDEECKQDYNSLKGRHVLGLLPSNGDLDLRSRIERNEDAHGIIRGRANSGVESKESVVWLSLQRRAWVGSQQQLRRRQLARIVVPSNLVTNNPDRNQKRTKHAGDVEFDDKVFAEQLKAGYHRLVGNWVARALSARKMQHICLGQTSSWSGVVDQNLDHGMPGLLATNEGIAPSEFQSPFTEQGLKQLYCSPKSGQARYTWVHWARRIAASNSSLHNSPPSKLPRMRSDHRRARSLDCPDKHWEQSAFSPYSDAGPMCTAPPDGITTIEFVHAFSSVRIFTALSLMLAVSVLAAILWVLLGTAGTGWRIDKSLQRSDRVGPGMAIGVFVLLLETLGFWAWLWLS